MAKSVITKAEIKIYNTISKDGFTIGLCPVRDIKHMTKAPKYLKEPTYHSTAD